MPLGGPGLAAGQFPAKYSFSVTAASCSDYVAYPTGAAGTASQATIVAYNSIYVGTGSCTTGNPSVYWAYNTPPGGTVADSATANLSPVVSYDGKQIAFIETYSGTGYLVLLTMASSGGTVGGPAAITYVSNANYHGCIGVVGGAPCYTTISLGTGDTNSAPYYAYNANDTIYVGDNTGKVHEVANVFSGTPAMDTVSGWPVTASTTTAPALYSPVYDSGASNRIFVTDAGGYLHTFTLAAPGTVTTSGRLETNSTNVFESPVVDSTTELVYTFIGYSGDTGHTSHPAYINRFPAAALGLTGTGTGGSDYGTSVYFSNGGANNPATSNMRAGSFDNLYYMGTGTTGNIYTCENGTVYQIPLATITTPVVNTFSTPVSAVGVAATCSPVTEIEGVKASTTLSAATTATTTTTTLSAAINHTTNPATTTLRTTVPNGTQGYVCVNSTANILAGDYIEVDTEIMYATATGSANCTGANHEVVVDRGVAGTTAAAHLTNGVTVTIYSTYITVATGANVVTGNYIQVGTEDMLVTATYTDTPGLTLQVTRGQLGTTAATAAGGATVTVLPQISIASSTGISVGDYVQIDSEIMSVLSVLSGPSLLVTRAQLGTTAAAHSNGAPVEDIADWLFMSIPGNASVSPCNGTTLTSCVYNYNVISGALTGAPTAGLSEPGGTSGIIIDNQSTTQTGAQQIYFTTTTGHTAVQASQSGLN